MSAITSSEAPGAAVSQPRFEGGASSFFWFVLRGGLLEIVTVGFYRFWLLTNMRRRLWSATSLDGDVLEYTGRAREILIGYLIALAILTPLFLGSFLLGLEAEDYAAFASTLFYGFVYLFFQFAVYRARRYRLSRTVWRGVRFWMAKGAWKYAFLSVGLMIVTLLTLGLANPWRVAALERYKFERTFYGDLSAHFEGKAWDLFKAGILYWVLVIPCLVFPPALLLIWGAYQAVEWRWFMRGLRMGETKFECRLQASKVIGLYLQFAGLVIATVLGTVIVLIAFLFLLTAAGAIGQDMTKLSNVSKALAVGPFFVGVAAIYLLALTIVGAFQRTFLIHELWRAIVASTTVVNAQALTLARKAGEASDAIGEGMLDGGLLDGFDLGAGF